MKMKTMNMMNNLGVLLVLVLTSPIWIWGVLVLKFTNKDKKQEPEAYC